MNIDKLVQALKLDEDHELDFKLGMIESVGSICLMFHWMRGIVDALVQNNNVQLNEAQKNNWNRVIKDMALYEEFIWEIAPPRAMLLALRHFRKTGELVENWESLLLQDTHGRIPYGLTEKTLDDIEDVVRKIKDARQKTGSTTYGHASSLTGVGRQIN